MKCLVKYFEYGGTQYWKCPNGFTGSAAKHLMSSEFCWKADCPGRKPNHAVCHAEGCEKPVVGDLEHYCSTKCHSRDTRKPTQETVIVCSREGCDKPKAPNKLRHCSEKCRNREKSARCREKKRLRMGTEEVKMRHEHTTHKMCAWKGCKNPKDPNKLRHCSEKCRKRDNRHAYRMRQKLIKEEKHVSQRA